MSKHLIVWSQLEAGDSFPPLYHAARHFLYQPLPLLYSHSLYPASVSAPAVQPLPVSAPASVSAPAVQPLPVSAPAVQPLPVSAPAVHPLPSCVSLNCCTATP